MSYSLPIFSTLIQKYPTWDALEAYLTGPDGGNFRVVGQTRYRILRYVKGVSDLSLDHGKWMRSVIWDTERHLPVCVAPPKAEKTITGEDISFTNIQEFMDGIMINVFRTVDNPNSLEIATRTQLGAGGKFYSEKTFAEMFEQALQSMKITKQDILDHLQNVDSNTPASFASFVLQHPEHRTVARCRYPRITIIQTGSVQKDGTVTIDESCDSWSADCKLKTFDPALFKESKETYFQNLCDAQGWYFQGITLKDGKGNRYRMRNPNYMYLRKLRGNEANTMDRFLRLRSESLVGEYLKHYSEDRQDFWDFEQKLRAKTQEVFAGYCSVHKSHDKKLEDLSWEIKPCVFKLHGHYLEHLRPNQEKVHMNNAVELVNNLPLFEQKRLLVPSK